MIEARIRAVAERQGITSSYQLQHALAVAPTVALRLWRGEVTRFSVETLDKLCTALQCTPGDLLIYTPPTGKSAQGAKAKK